MVREDSVQLVWQRFKLSGLGREAVVSYLKTSSSPSERALLAVIDEPYPLSEEACKPYRARTKGKVESGVKYVKRNALAGHEFDDWPAFERHLSWWMDEIADTRIHGTTGEPPLVRFEREEAQALTLFQADRAFGVVLEHERVVNSEACVNFETNSYSSEPTMFVSKQRHHLRCSKNMARLLVLGGEKQNT